MIDHIIYYDDPSTRPGGDAATWRDDRRRIWMPVDCIITDAVHELHGDDLVEVSPPVHAPGAWMVVRARTLQDDIVADPRCVIVSDADRAERGEPFVLLNRLRPTTSLGRITPVFAGDNYPFPTGSAAQLAPLMVVG